VVPLAAGPDVLGDVDPLGPVAEDAGPELVDDGVLVLHPATSRITIAPTATTTRRMLPPG
jgi:hypothetical protein